MARLFEQRERAAEGIFAHDEEARFVAHRRGLEALAAWASESMSFDETTRVAYADRLLDAYISGVREDEIIAAVQTDLERAGKPTLTGQVGLVLSQAIAEATAQAHARPGTPHASHKEKSASPRKPILGWSL